MMAPERVAASSKESDSGFLARMPSRLRQNSEKQPSSLLLYGFWEMSLASFGSGEAGHVEQ